MVSEGPQRPQMGPQRLMWALRGKCVTPKGKSWAPIEHNTAISGRCRDLIGQLGAYRGQFRALRDQYRACTGQFETIRDRLGHSDANVGPYRPAWALRG